AVLALMGKSVYDRLELTTGRMAKINRGDVIAGTLGYRRALKGFVGIVPETVHVGDTIHVLNLGGVLGLCVGRNPYVGSPLETEVLGAVLLTGLPAHISRNALAPFARAILAELGEMKPDVIVVELGDGILGDYRVGTFFSHPDLVSATKAVVMCANDLVAAWGAQKLMEQWNIPITVVSGPVT